MDMAWLLVVLSLIAAVLSVIAGVLGVIQSLTDRRNNSKVKGEPTVVSSDISSTEKREIGEIVTKAHEEYNRQP